VTARPKTARSAGPAAAAALAAVLALGLAAAAPADPLFGVAAIEEGAAHAEGASPLRFNPATTGTRYPGEFGFTFLDERFAKDGYALSLERHGLRLAAAGAEDEPLAFSLGGAGGRVTMRSGWAVSWLPKPGGGRVTDWRFGFLSRPAPWFSLGGVADHLAQPALGAARLGREYSLGLAVRPLALSRPRAHTLGTRLTLAADVRLRETDRADDARLRLSAEAEIVSGLVVRGAWLDDERGFQAGVALLGPQSGTHVTQSCAGDDASTLVRTAYTVSLHEAEDRTSFAGRRERRVAVVRAGGSLADDALAGWSIDGATRTVPVASLHRQLERALEDPLTRGVLLDLRGLANMAQVEELRPRVERLRRAGKPVVAYLEYGARRGDLFLAAACDRIVAPPEAPFRGLGLLAERRYWRGLLEKWGVRIDRTSYGRYKSAYREYSVDSTTAADRESLDDQLDTVQELFVSTVAADRRMDRSRLLGLLDGRAWTAADARDAGLVDTLGYRADALRVLGGLAGLGARPRTVRLASRPAATPEWAVPSRIAIVYASGSIEVGRSGSDLLLGPFMGSETVSAQVDRAFRRRDVGAVVLRVESGGGSSLGSELIHHAVARAKRETGKPLIVSMGLAAASGGYHISTPADRIYADRFTRTGSIGVLFVRPSLEGFYRRQGVRQDDFARGDAMRGWSMGHDWDAAMQASADSATYREYRDFVGVVARDRGLSWSAVDSVAQGRVWLGEAAQRHRLVDEIGGLEDAVAEARRRAGVPEGEKIRPLEFRRPQPWFLQRWIGSLVTAAVESSLRLPEPGQTLYWDDSATAEP
jgi:protease-4